MAYNLFIIFILTQTFPMVSWETQIEIVCKIYILGKLTYQLTTLGFTKLFVFYLIGSCLWYIIAKFMVKVLYNIILISYAFPTLFWVTETNILCKSYTLGKLTYQVTTLGLRKLHVFHIIRSCLGYNISKSIG